MGESPGLVMKEGFMLGGCGGQCSECFGFTIRCLASFGAIAHSRSGRTQVTAPGP